MSSFRYIRVVESEEIYRDAATSEESLEHLLQKRFSKSEEGQLSSESRPLLGSISLYRVGEDLSVCAELNVLHTATACLGKPNPLFLDVTPMISGRECPQEDSSSPFKGLSNQHHSLKFSSEDDLRDWARRLVRSSLVFHEIDRSEMDSYVQRVASKPLGQEWQVAESGLLARYGSLPSDRKRNFNFWVKAGLLP